MNSYYNKGDYGKIDYLYDCKGTTKIGETVYFNNKKEYEKEIHDSVEIGRPIDPTKYNKFSMLKEENEFLKTELLLTRKAADIYKNDQQEFWDMKTKESTNEPIKIISLRFAPNQYEEENER